MPQIKPASTGASNFCPSTVLQVAISAHGEKVMRFLAASVLAFAFLSSEAKATTYYNIAVECKFDIEQYCKNIPKIRIRDLRACLAKHEKDLFPRCQDHYKAAR